MIIALAVAGLWPVVAARAQEAKTTLDAAATALGVVLAVVITAFEALVIGLSHVVVADPAIAAAVITTVVITAVVVAIRVVATLCVGPDAEKQRERKCGYIQREADIFMYCR